MTEVARPVPPGRAAPPGTQPRFGRITDPNRRPAPPTGPDFATIADSAEFQALRSRYRRYVFPMSALFFLWYLTYVLLAAYAPGFMGVRLTGLVTIGLIMGLLQFVSTIAITVLYIRFSRRALDPQVHEIRRAAGLDRPGPEQAGAEQ